jgi:ribA/ribD-fused uncharacterized protein
MGQPLRVQFIHGLESNPQGTKARFLAAHFDALAPAMDTRSLEGSIATQAAALEAFRPDVVVGSSFGGAVTVALLARGVWRGPTVLLAPAAAKLGVDNRLPGEVTATVVHGVDDDIVPLADSRALVAGTAPARVTLREVPDGHRLQTLVESGSLAALVRETHARAQAPLPEGARLRVDDGPLAEPYAYLSRRQADWCEAHGLGALAPHLPCWAPQRRVSAAAFGNASSPTLEAVTARHGPWVWATEFSNVHTTFAFDEPGFELDGARHASVEHYFQAAKSLGTPDHASARRALAADPDPARAFRVGRTHALRPDWESVKRDVMRAGLRAKFTQDAGLRALLASTGTAPLVQFKPGDAEWGTGPDGRGANALGELLMELRAALREGAR